MTNEDFLLMYQQLRESMARQHTFAREAEEREARETLDALGREPECELEPEYEEPYYEDDVDFCLDCDHKYHHGEPCWIETCECNGNTR